MVRVRLFCFSTALLARVRSHSIKPFNPQPTHDGAKQLNFKDLLPTSTTHITSGMLLGSTLAWHRLSKQYYCAYCITTHRSSWISGALWPCWCACGSLPWFLAGPDFRAFFPSQPPPQIYWICRTVTTVMIVVTILFECWGYVVELVPGRVRPVNCWCPTWVAFLTLVGRIIFIFLPMPMHFPLLWWKLIIC